jgi:N4-gp56 family major capsid protein
MAEVVLATASQKQVWMSKYFMEYVRDSRFMPYMSNADLNKGGVILTRYELQKEAGKTINIPFIGRLKGRGVAGSEVLDGNEEALTNYNFPISVAWRRNGVRVPKSESFMTEVNLLDAAKDGLQTWESEKLRDDVIEALASFVTDTSGATVNFGDSSSTNRNTHNANNSDRLLFGATKSNYSATWATAIGNVDTTSDKITYAALMLMKRMAKSADPHIRPFKTNATKGREYYVVFMGARSFRDAAADTTIISYNKDARARENGGMDENPLFQDGDLIVNGLILREVPEIDDVLTAGTYSADGIGNTSADVRPVVLCGAGAVAVAWGQEPTPRTDYVKDYGFRPGVAIEELIGVKKVNYNGKMNGMVVGWFAAAADS